MLPLISPEPVPLPDTVNTNFSGLDTPRIVKSPSTSNVSGPVCTSFVDLNVINGFCSTAKKSLPFSLPFFIPLPVSTLAAWILISSTPVVSSGEVNVSVASHLSNFPAILTDDFTWKLIQLSTGVISKIGACDRLSSGNTPATRMQKIAGRMRNRLIVIFRLLEKELGEQLYSD